MKKRHLRLAVVLVAVAGSADAAPVRISEVLYDAVGSDNGRVFVELHAAAGFDLAGWTLEGINGTDGAVGPVVQLQGLVPGDGFFVLADVASGVTEVPNADLLSDFDFQNGPDSIVLRDSLGNAVDALGYGTFGPGDVFAGEGNPATDPSSGVSLARMFANVDTDDNAADFIVLDPPTPGVGAASVAEPQVLLLLAAALTGAALWRTRSARTAGRPMSNAERRSFAAHG